jgi:sarcosine oxidase subunit beta
MARKVLLCRCEDVTEHDVARAVAAGFDDLEEVKRYTGFGTGPCQGKECLRNVAAALTALTGRASEAIAPFTARPPLVPTPLRLLAAPRPEEANRLEPAPTAPASEEGSTPTPSSTRAFSSVSRVASEVDVLVVGAGIMGLALASHLARQSRLSVQVVEAGHLASGASGRNGGGVRQQWASERNIRLMQESMALCASFAQDMGENIWMRRGGYLFLAAAPDVCRRLEAAVALQNTCGVATQLLDAQEARQLVPELETAPFAVAAFNPTDAVVFPWPFLWGYARDALSRGVRIATFTAVTRIEAEGRSFRVETTRGAVRAARVVCCAGAWSPRVAALVDVKLPNWPVRHEILSTEALKPCLGPLVSVLDSGLYISQSMRGELVGGIGLPERVDGEIHMSSRLVFLQTMARELVGLMPRLADVKVVRQWAGPYDLTPDGQPLLGEVRARPGFFVACGFHGHGFMMAPAVARHLGQHLLGHARHEILEAWRPDRFAEGVQGEKEMVIG